ncbi:adenylate and guanylate cyclase catalytic domain-containing protein [Ditylenchus destructor]|nr:adenylate and guanylate cyclase catalytic domain-containing protein [Ditylenchus destructor]
MSGDLNNQDEPDEAMGMLAHAAAMAPAGTQLANGSSGHTLAEQARAHSSSPRRIPLFERASARWWNPQFASSSLETQYWKCSFSLLKNRFRSGLIYIFLTCLLWMIYLIVFGQDRLHHWLVATMLTLLCVSMFLFTSWSVHYQRFYLPTSFLCIFLICMITLLIFSSLEPFMGPLASMATSIQVVLLIYTVIPLPLYLSLLIGVCYSCLFELLSNGTRNEEFAIRPGSKLALHACIHVLGVHLFILTQVRQRKTFLKVGQSLLARKDLELETQFKDHMIQSVMPKKVADELLKESSELRRPSQSFDSNCRTSNATTAGRSSAAESTAGLTGGVGGAANALIAGPTAANNTNVGSDGARFSNSMPSVRKFRPFTMNLMTDVSILFADIAGFTKMSSNKSADELVNLLNDLFGRFDYLCGRCNLEKISTLGDCYYCVAGCPEPRPDHAKCCVEMGLAMIIAIRQFDMDRGQSVNMRVGIHTGKVMCGMVGTKRFKFDVFSNDVTLANEMESTGVAGRVHISQSTANFLDNYYVLEDAPEHKGIKTYFIAGRTKEFESTSCQFINPSDTESAKDHTATALDNSQSQTDTSQKLSFRKKLVCKLKTIQSTSLPISRATTNSTGGGGGSLRMKLLEKNNKAQTCSAQILNQEDQDVQSQSMYCTLPDDPRKSSSLQALNSDNGPPPPAPPSSAVPLTGADSTQHSVPPEPKSWTIAERIGGKISIDLANGSSNNSGRGSRSSGMQDVGSEAHSIGGLDTAISHHHNAASLTRFDTENRDFDQRLAQVIYNNDGSFAKDFWMHPGSLNRWTLHFNQKDIEEEYRAHFAESTDRHTFPKTGIAKHHQLEKGRMQLEAAKNNPRYRYSGVFVDIIVSAVVFCITSGVMFAGLNREPSPFFIVYFATALMIMLAVICLVGIPLLSRRTIMPSSKINLWWPRHILGCLLIALPIGVALFNMPFCLNTSPSFMLCIPTEGINQRLIYGYIFLVAIYAHCNFSQLSAWPKTAQGLVMAVVFLVTTWLCQNNLDYIRRLDALFSGESNVGWNEETIRKHEPPPFSVFTTSMHPDSASSMQSCNRTQPHWSHGQFGSPLFLWELILDVVLAAILVAFLNYQFETAFRMSFFSDVQARRDTAKMQLVRDQADWLLTNIIPQHAVESLKTNTKYSENHNLTAVLFANITNWNEMYEENFEGGREFLRVLNEVIGDFDELLDRSEFSHVEKIKTIGATYMAASGLNPDRRRLSLHPYEHLYQLVEFALALQNALAFFNQDLLSFDFVCKLGLNIGPVTAGVIGTTKLYYDIWGDTVNIASRMYSCGVENRIQVSQYTRDLLIDRYDFEYRDHIEVKGVDGGMDTYLLVGRKGEPPLSTLSAMPEN